MASQNTSFSYTRPQYYSPYPNCRSWQQGQDHRGLCGVTRPQELKELPDRTLARRYQNKKILERDVSAMAKPNWLNTNSELLIQQLNQYLSPEEQSILRSEASDPLHQHRLEMLKTPSSWKSHLMHDPETCNTLYWGLFNNEISPEQFLEFYSLLTLNITFFPSRSIIPNQEDLRDFASSITTTETAEGWQHTLTLTDEMKKYRVYTNVE